MAGIRFVYGALALACIVATLLPLVPSDHWWVRMWDFPRGQIAVTALAFAGLGAFLMRGLYLFIPAALIVCVGLQSFKILPFTPLVEPEIDLCPAGDGQTPVSMFAANVLMENRSYDRLADMIDADQPDIVLLMETDQRWLDALSDTLSGYPTVLDLPLDNTYGMVFATRLEASRVEMLFLTDNETPTVLAAMETPEGQPFRFVGLHPRPPIPGEDTDERDAQIQRAATFAQNAGVPVVAMGDFNDVAWSHNAQLFKRSGDYLDPRVGRGFLSSFDATNPILRFPIDQLYVTEGVNLISFERGGHIGSDHFPMKAVITIDP